MLPPAFEESAITGENVELGDFFGLDDLFTEHPDVVAGMIDIYRDVITEFDVDGFRVDTAKHVNDEFWFEFLPAIYQQAAESYEQAITNGYTEPQVYMQYARLLRRRLEQPQQADELMRF